MNGPVKVGEILLEAGLIDEMQLRAALGEQTRWGRPLGATLVKLGFVEEHDLVRALASQLDLPVARIEGKRIHPEVLALVPRRIAEAHNIVPLFVKQCEHGADQLYLGMEDPGNLEVLDDLAFRTGMELRPVMVGPSELDAAVDRYYRQLGPDGQVRSAGEETAVESPLVPSAETKSEVATPNPASQTVAPPGTEELVRHWTQIEVPSARVDDPSAGESSGPVEPDLGGSPDEPVELVVEAEAEAEAEGSPSSVREPEPADPEPSEAAPVALVDEAPAENANSARSSVAEAAPISAARAVSEADEQPTVAEVDTRTILRALTQLLIEKGLLTREELHARVNALRQLETEQRN